MRSKISYRIVLFLVLLTGFFARTIGSNWDQGFHLHPDERMIQMTALSLTLPKNIVDFFTTQSGLNPHFFAYGNFPIYLLKAVSFLLGKVYPAFATYENISLVGRFISGFSDTLIILVIFIIAKKVYSISIGIFASFFYAVSVLPIQNAHYYTVDTLLVLFVSLTLFLLVIAVKKPSYKISVLAGIFFGLSLATKISAITLLIPIITFCFLNRAFKKTLILLIAASTIFSLTQPYALIDLNEFIKQNILQYAMTRNPFIFTYTLEYVGKIPFIYELESVALWGLGPFLFIFALLGFGIFIKDILKTGINRKNYSKIILCVFFLSYFILTSSLSTGFMRYMLPVYPLFCLFAAVFFLKLCESLRRLNKILYFLIILIFLLLITAWPLSFITIYDTPNTRVLASAWINKNIPQNKVIATEHWDDVLPLYGQEKYKFETLELFNEDTTIKWDAINEQLKKADYIAIASNRLYGPIEKLIDCQIIERYRCYPITARYYKNLFSGNLGFKKVAEFENFPRIPGTKLYINDISADESFTVNDHPKIMIYKKSSL